MLFAKRPSYRRRRRLAGAKRLGWAAQSRGARGGRLDGCFRLDLADRFFQRQTLARHIAFRQRRIERPQLIDQSLTGALVDSTALLVSPLSGNRPAQDIGEINHRFRMPLPVATAHPSIRSRQVDRS